MGLTVRRIGVATASAQIVVEYDEHVAAPSTNGSTNVRRHQVVSLTQEAMGMPAPSLATSLRQSLPQLFPSYVGDEVLVPLLQQMLQLRLPASQQSRVALPSTSSSSSSYGASTTSAAEAPAAAAAIPAVIATIGDLQRVGPAALQAAKSRMDVVFEANRVRPGEEGFRYDVRVDFPAQNGAVPDEPNEWDDE